MESIETKTTDIRTIYKTEEFEEFYNDLNARVKDKFEYTFFNESTSYNLFCTQQYTPHIPYHPVSDKESDTIFQ